MGHVHACMQSGRRTASLTGSSVLALLLRESADSVCCWQREKHRERGRGKDRDRQRGQEEDYRQSHACLLTFSGF